MSLTPLNSSQGNSHCSGAPTITITAAHRESLKKPEHTTILHKASQTMFAKPAKRPGPASGFSWFRQPSYREGNGTVNRPDYGPKCKPHLCNPSSGGQMNPQSRTTRSSDRPKPEPYNSTLGGPISTQSYNPQSSARTKPQPRSSITYGLQSPADYRDPLNPQTWQTSPSITVPLCEPAMRATPKPGTPGAAGQPRPSKSKSFDEWMAKFCVEPPDDLATCCLAFWLPCAQYGKTHWRLKQVEEGREPWDASWEPKCGCNGPSWAWFGMCYLLQCDCLLTGFQRTRIRATYGIKGSIAEDFALAFFCRPCTMVQMDREVRAREGDMNLRTNPNAPIIEHQPSQFQPMRYVSPRATASDCTQNSRQNLQDSCDGVDPFDMVTEAKKLPKQPKSDKSKPGTARIENVKSAMAKSETIISDKFKPDCPQSKTLVSEKAKSSKINISQQTDVIIVEMSQINKPHAAGSLKSVGFKTSKPNSNSSSHNASSPISYKMAQDDVKSMAKTSNPTFSACYSGKSIEVRSTPAPSSTHDVVDYRPEVPPKGADSKRDGESSADKKEKMNETHPQQHALASCSTVKVEESDITVHKPAECTRVKLAKEEGKTSEHTIVDDETIVLDFSKAKSNAAKKDNSNTTDTHELSYVHDFTDCPVDKNVLEYYEKEEKRSQASQHHALTNCSTTSSPAAPSPTQHALSECPEEKTSGKAKSKSTGLNLHALVDCEHADESKANSINPELHALADCKRESVNSAHQPTTPEQHALAECRGDASRQSRRASSPPNSPTDKSHQAKQHRLASCPVHRLSQEEAKPVIAHHVAENAHINQSDDSQSTVKPSSQHTLSDCMGGAKLERQGAASDRQMKTERHASLSSLRDLIKGSQDAADHPQRSRYRKEIKINTNFSETKRTSKAHSALSNVLAGRGGKKENSHKEHSPVVGGVDDAIQDAGGAVTKQTDNIGDAVKNQADKIGNAVKKQTDRPSGKEEHKNGFSSVFSKMTSPKTKAQQ